MTWARIESSMPRHPKVIGLSVHAKWAFVEVLCWCVSNGTDGHIPESVPHRSFTDHRESQRVIRELVEAGLLEQNGNGLIVHDFEHYQMSGAQDKARRQAATIRKRKERERKLNAPA